MIARRQERVRRDDAGEPLPVLGHEPETDESPNPGTQRRSRNLGFGKKGRHRIHVPLVRVVLARGGFVRATEADQVRRDCAEPCADDARDDLAVQKRPGRLSVEHQHDRRIARALVHEVHPDAGIAERNLGVPRHEWEQRGH